MGVRRAPSPPPDRLAAVLGELDRARTVPGWLPDEEAVTDRRPPRERRTKKAAGRTGRTKGGAVDEEASEPRHLRRGQDTAVRPHSPMVRTPASLEGAVIAPSRLALVAVLVLLVAAGSVLGGRLLWVRATAAPQPVSSSSLPPASAPPSGLSSGGGPGVLGSSAAGVPAGQPASAVPGATNAPAAAPSGSPLVVDVVGEVHHPGVVRLPPGSRVEDAVTAAGGASSAADVTRINMARPLVDGEQVRVPRPGEELTPPPAAVAGGGPAGAAGADGGVPGSAGAAGVPVNLNTADLAALDGLPGVGPVIAGRILQWRTDNGRFTSVDELGEVSGIGEKMLAQIRPHVTV